MLSFFFYKAMITESFFSFKQLGETLYWLYCKLYYIVNRLSLMTVYIICDLSAIKDNSHKDCIDTFILPYVHFHCTAILLRGTIHTTLNNNNYYCSEAFPSHPSPDLGQSQLTSSHTRVLLEKIFKIKIFIIFVLEKKKIIFLL